MELQPLPRIQGPSSWKFKSRLFIGECIQGLNFNDNRPFLFEKTTMANNNNSYIKDPRCKAANMDYTISVLYLYPEFRTDCEYVPKPLSGPIGLISMD
jgi:hypothetical protein